MDDFKEYCQLVWNKATDYRECEAEPLFRPFSMLPKEERLKKYSDNPNQKHREVEHDINMFNWGAFLVNDLDADFDTNFRRYRFTTKALSYVVDTPIAYAIQQAANKLECFPVVVRGKNSLGKDVYICENPKNGKIAKITLIR